LLHWLRSRFAAFGMTLAMALAGAAILAPAVLIAVVAISFMRPHPRAPAAPSAPGEEALPDYVSFIDRFRDLDDDRWVFSDGWDNGEWVDNDWQRSTLHPSPDGMSIVMGPSLPGSEKPYSSGELQSQDTYRYGYFEVRMRVPHGSGTGVGFFTYTEPEGRASWQEIDIEFIGRETRHIELTVHLGGRTFGDKLRLPFDAAEGFHTYAFEWTPRAVRWYIDNELAYEINDPAMQQVSRPQRLYLSLWASKITIWAGQLDRSRAPWTLGVTCVAQAREYRGVSLCAPAAPAQDHAE
jgi:beta-glucanase (GH16 family)